MEQHLSKALAAWNSPEFQALLVPLRTLGSISAMFWMLARLADLLMAVLKRVVFAEAYALLNAVYAAALAAAYAAMMFYTALEGDWHPSLLWRGICGFAFMYVMLGVTFRDGRTGRLKPHTPPAFFLGVVAYLFLVRAPSLVRTPGAAEFHRVLELFAAGGWGYLMTGITVLVMAWSIGRMLVSEFWFGLSPLLFRLKLIRSLPIRFRFDAEGGGRGVVPSLSRSWFLLTLLAGGAAAGWHFRADLRAAGGAAAPAIRSRAQSPEAAEAASRLARVLPAVSFAAVGSLPRQGAVADLATPVFRKLLSAPREADRWLAAAALDRLDPGFSVSAEELFVSTGPELACSRSGSGFRLLPRPLPGEDPGRSVTWWIADGRGVHFTGVGPGEFREIPGSGDCAAAAFGPAGGPVLLAFAESPPAPGGAWHLWFSAYDPGERRVLAAFRAGAGPSADFRLSTAPAGVTWADSPPGRAAGACGGGCGTVLGREAEAISTEPLAEYRGAAVKNGAIETTPLAELTYERSGLAENFRSLAAFKAAFRFDPAAGFLNRWYRSALLSDGSRCVSVELDPSLPGAPAGAEWHCGR